MMCGRFTQHYTWAEANAFLDLFGAPRNLRPRYNIAPTDLVHRFLGTNHLRWIHVIHDDLYPGL
jgi:putative SOS response-associated peptidase YedK